MSFVLPCLDVSQRDGRGWRDIGQGRRWGGGGGGEEREREIWMDGWMVYCIINGLTRTIFWVNDMQTRLSSKHIQAYYALSKSKVMDQKFWVKNTEYKKELSN